MDIVDGFDCPFAPESIMFPSSTARHRAPRTRRALVERALRYMISHADRRVGLTEIGDAVGASPTYLTQAFRDIVGIPLYRYEINLRLARARDLVSGYDDLATLALNFGFSSHSHFATAFRRAYGCTPAEFRSEVRAAHSPVDTRQVDSPSPLL